MPDLRWQFHETPFIRFFCNVSNKHGFPGKQEKKTLYRRGLNMTPQKNPDWSCIMPNESWKFHENPFVRFTVMLLTITNKQVDKPTEIKNNLCHLVEVIKGFQEAEIMLFHRRLGGGLFTCKPFIQNHTLYSNNSNALITDYPDPHTFSLW